MNGLDSTYSKPFLTVPQQVRRLRERGMDCGTDAYAVGILERYGYYRLSGYWHPFRSRPTDPELQFDEEGREVRHDTFVLGTTLRGVVALYEFDHDLRTQLGEVLSRIEISLRFFIGHRIGRADAFAHRNPELLGATREAESHAVARSCFWFLRQASPPRRKATVAYEEWLTEFDRHETRAREAFVLHFRKKYGPHLPIWVATEVMSFGVMSNLYTLMGQADQEILAARFQLHARDGRGDRTALGNWLNNARNVRNICAHYGRIWNRTFDVLIDAPGQARASEGDHLCTLAEESVNNKVYGVLVVLRHLMLSVAPDRMDVVDIVQFIKEQSREIGFRLSQLGFPDDWESDPLWGRGFGLDRTAMVAANLLDRTEMLTAPQARAVLSGAEAKTAKEPRTEDQMAAAQQRAQKELLRTYIRYQVVIEIELARTKYYPKFQFRDGKIIEALAEINKNLHELCVDGAPKIRMAEALLDWWQTPHPKLVDAQDGLELSPLELLDVVAEDEFMRKVEEVGALSTFSPPGCAE